MGAFVGLLATILVWVILSIALGVLGVRGGEGDGIVAMFFIVGVVTWAVVTVIWDDYFSPW
jgi:hypothetical protein